jgi:hypothetical protein
MDRVGVGGFHLRRCVIGLVQYRVPANFLGRDAPSHTWYPSGFLQPARPHRPLYQSHALPSWIALSFSPLRRPGVSPTTDLGDRIDSPVLYKTPLVRLHVPSLRFTFFSTLYLYLFLSIIPSTHDSLRYWVISRSKSCRGIFIPTSVLLTPPNVKRPRH